LTLAAVIDNKVFCVHGGLSPTITTISEVRKQHIMNIFLD